MLLSLSGSRRQGRRPDDGHPAGPAVSADAGAYARPDDGRPGVRPHRDRVPRQAGGRAQAARAVHHRWLSGLAGCHPCGGRERCRRHRDRDPVLRPGHGRPRHPAGLAVRARAGCHTGVGARRGAAARRRHPARRDDVLQPRPSSRRDEVRLRPRRAGICAAILPDLPLEESGDWCEAADAAGIETILLAAPTAPDDRLPRVAARSRGFIYSVGLLGVTGERESLAATATALAGRLKAITDMPVLVGVGCLQRRTGVPGTRVADGVIQGASVVRRLMDGGPDAVGDYVAEVRAAIDAA